MSWGVAILYINLLNTVQYCWLYYGSCCHISSQFTQSYVDNILISISSGKLGGRRVERRGGMGGGGIQHEHHRSLQVGEGLDQDLAPGTQGLRQTNPGPLGARAWEDLGDKKRKGTSPSITSAITCHHLSWHVDLNHVMMGGCKTWGAPL